MTTYTRYTEILERFRNRPAPVGLPGVILAVIAELPNGDGEVSLPVIRREAVRDFQKSVQSGQYKTVVLLRGAIVMAQWEAPSSDIQSDFLAGCLEPLTPEQARQQALDNGQTNRVLPQGESYMYVISESEQPEPKFEEPGYTGDGFTNEYDYSHPLNDAPAQDETIDSEDESENDGLEDETAITVHRIRQYQQIIEDAQARIYEQKERLEALLQERGSNWQDDDGYARLAAPYQRVNYSREALDTLILDDPSSYGWLKQYRHESTVAGRVVVK